MSAGDTISLTHDLTMYFTPNLADKPFVLPDNDHLTLGRQTTMGNVDLSPVSGRHQSCRRPCRFIDYTTDTPYREMASEYM